jgi:hypothetical protein
VVRRGSGLRVKVAAQTDIASAWWGIHCISVCVLAWGAGAPVSKHHPPRDIGLL